MYDLRRKIPSTPRLFSLQQAWREKLWNIVDLRKFTPRESLLKMVMV